MIPQILVLQGVGILVSMVQKNQSSKNPPKSDEWFLCPVCHVESYREEAPCENCEAHHVWMQGMDRQIDFLRDSRQQGRDQRDRALARVDELVEENLALRKKRREAFVFSSAGAFLFLASLAILSLP